MKRTIIALFLGVCVSFPSFATEPEQYNFAKIHPESTLSNFLESNAFIYGTIGLSAIVGVVVTYMSAGAGAPAVATGMSSIATWAGGSGVGSYMAGLSTIGGFFGGNAITGAAVLNGVSFLTVIFVVAGFFLSLFWTLAVITAVVGPGGLEPPTDGL